jgi:peptidoglycan/xylan/chitin deacetylase (PgdA/CDA1 family)
LAAELPPAEGPWLRFGVQLGVPFAPHVAAPPGSLGILMYHGVVREPLAVQDSCFVTEAQFERQMRYIRRHCTVVGLSDGLERLRRGALHGSTVAITFDDGFQSVHDLAFPILRRLGLPATVFVCTGFVDTDETIWFCRLLQAIGATSRTSVRWRGEDLNLSSPAARARASDRMQADLKALPYSELLQELAQATDLLDQMSVMTDTPNPRFRILDTPSIERMAASRLVDFGAHTVHHAIVSRLPCEQARAEIVESVRATAAITGRPCRLFAFPNGRADDYDRAAIEALRGCGVEAAVTTREGVNTEATPSHELRRLGMGPSSPLTSARNRGAHLLSRSLGRLSRRPC